MRKFELQGFIKLHNLIEIAKKYEDSSDFGAKYDFKIPNQYIICGYAVMDRYRFAMFQACDTIWYYAHNPGIHTLFELFRGTAKEFSGRFGIPYKTVKRWIDGKEVVPEYVLELIFSEMLMDPGERYYHHSGTYDDLFVNTDVSDIEDEDFY